MGGISIPPLETRVLYKLFHVSFPSNTQFLFSLHLKCKALNLVFLYSVKQKSLGHIQGTLVVNAKHSLRIALLFGVNFPPISLVKQLSREEEAYKDSHGSKKMVLLEGKTLQ